VMYISIPNTQEAKVWGSQVRDQPDLHSELLVILVIFGYKIRPCLKTKT
jgi:hypothetical protein